MKSFITPEYTFSPGASNTGFVTLTGVDNFDIKKLVSIINLTKGKIIYNPADAAATYYSITDKKVVLKYDTSSHGSSDLLAIIYEEDPVMEESILQMLSIIANNMPKLDNSKRQVVYLENLNGSQSSLPVNINATMNLPVVFPTSGTTAPLPLQFSQMAAAFLYQQIIIS